ncbi:fibronectin type III domain-containing protein [Corallococcus exercitus]|uniref:fibronectin type III domain-containing protein n=1 Tax=Corallococcus exercitus TaxID=2316736 RepID=UPI0035D481AB
MKRSSLLSLRPGRVLAMLALLPFTAGAAPLYVSPGGSDSNAGTSATAPLKTLQAALDKATAGTTIHLAAGIYRERPTTKRAGTASAPITLKGPETGKARSGRYKAVLFGTGRIFNVDHSHYVLEGFTIDGQEKLLNAAWPTSLSGVSAFKDANTGLVADGRLIYIGSSETSRDITGVVIRDMFLNGAGGECIRMRNNAHHNEIANSVIQWCGLYAKDSSDGYRYHNGEGVYIGTSPKSTSQPMYANDTSSFNTVHGNTIHTFGSECFNVKENAHDNTFARNDCRYNDEPVEYLGSLVELRGHHNVLDSNVLAVSRGYALKMKSDSDAYDLGGNSATNNTFQQATGAFIRNDNDAAQATFCGNTFDTTAPVVTGASVGTPTAPCAGTGTDTTPPTAPGGLTASAVSSNEVELAWSASTDNVGVTSYKVFRGGTTVCTVSALGCGELGLSPATTYSYTVRAYDAAGNASPASSTVSVTTPPGTGTALLTDGFESYTSFPTGGWTNASGNGTWAIVTDGTKAARQQSSSSATYILTGGQATWANYSHSARVKTGSTAIRNGLVARYVDGNNFYFLVLHNGNLVLNKKVAGSTTVLQTVPFPASTSAFYTLTLTVSGTSLQGFVDGVLRVQGTDTSLTAGRPGFYATGVATYDDVRVTSP